MGRRTGLVRFRPGVYVVVAAAVATIIWALVRVVRRIVALPRLARSPYGPAVAHDVLALQALLASVVAGVLAVVAVGRGARLTDDILPASLYPSMSDTRWWQWLMLAGLAVALVLVPEVAVPIVGAAGVIVIGGSIAVVESSDGSDTPDRPRDPAGDVTAAAGHTAAALPPDPNRKPRGTRTRARQKKEDLGVRRENEAADTLARRGYDVEQNPGRLPGTSKNPDYRIQGEYWDCYSPRTSNLRTIRNEIRSKVKDGIPRVVLDLDDYPGTLDAIKSKLLSDPVGGLKEILIVKDGAVLPFFPF